MGRTHRSAIGMLLVVCFAHVDGWAQTPAPEGWVVLPVDEYRSLREKALLPAVSPVSPVEATLTRIDYSLRAENDVIVGQAQLTVDVLRDGWARVQIPSGLMARDARLDGQPVSLVAGPQPSVILSRTGRSVLTLEIALPLRSAAGAESIVLPASTAPITRAAIALPRSGVDLSVTGGFVIGRSEGPGESRWAALGRPGQALQISWRRKVDDRRSELPLRVRARVTQLVGLAEDASQVTASVRIEVAQGVARDVEVALPPELVVNQVDGATVSDWDVANGMLRVRFLDPVSTDTSFVVQCELKAPRDGAMTIPLVRVPAAERESGGVAVDVVGAGEIVARLPRGLEPADPSELGDVVTGRESPSMAAFRMRPSAGTEARSLAVTVVRYTPQAVLIANVEEARYRALVAEDGRLLVEARYAVRNNQRSFLKVTLPAGSRVWSASVAGRPTRPGVAEQEAVLLPLAKGRAGAEAPTFVVSLIYVQSIGPWPQKGRARIDLPALDLPVSRTGVTLHYSPRFTVLPEPGAFRLETDPGPSAEAFRPVSPRAGTGGGVGSGAGRGPGAGPGVAGGLPDGVAAARSDQQALQSIIDQFRNESGGRTVVGAIPVDVPFPVVGPSVFLASELTAEARAPRVDLTVKRK